jgi:transcriptional regulator with XRE-family HTH domain
VNTDPEDAAYRIGREIRRIRRAQDMSQETLAVAADVNLKHYGEIERGRRPGVKLDTLLRITDALDVPLWRVLEAAARPSTRTPDLA